MRSYVIIHSVCIIYNIGPVYAVHMCTYVQRVSVNQYVRGHTHAHAHARARNHTQSHTQPHTRITCNKVNTKMIIIFPCSPDIWSNTFVFDRILKSYELFVIVLDTNQMTVI